MELLAREPYSKADMTNMVQLIFGFSDSNWNRRFQKHKIEYKDGMYHSPELMKIVKLGWTFGIIHYGMDILLGLVTEDHTVSFKQIDARIPEMLMLLPSDAYAMFPLSNNFHRLELLYEYFHTKGWLYERKWIIFWPHVARFPRYAPDKAYINNARFINMKAKFPELHFMSCASILPAIETTHLNDIVLADILLPSMYEHVLSLYRYSADNEAINHFLEWITSFSEFGFSCNTDILAMPQFHDLDKQTFDQICIEYNITPPHPPTVTNNAEQIKGWIRSQGGRFFLHDKFSDWFVAAENDIVARPELRKLVIEQ